MLEEKIDELIKAINRLTNTLLKSGDAPAENEKPTTGKGKAAEAKATKPAGKKKVDADAVRAAVIKFAQANSKKDAMDLMKAVADTTSIADIPEDKFQAVLDAIEKGVVPKDDMEDL